MYQVWRFIAPGLYTNEKKLAIPFVALSTLGILGGAAFNHYMAFPFMMAFFGTFDTPGPAASCLAAQPPSGRCIQNFSSPWPITFQMPTIVFFLARMRLVTARFPREAPQLYAILIIFIVAAVVTPSGDPVTQTVFAAPMIGLILLEHRHRVGCRTQKTRKNGLGFIDCSTRRPSD